MASNAQSLLASGLRLALAQLGRTYLFGSTRFTAIPDTLQPFEGQGGRGLSVGRQSVVTLHIASGDLASLPAVGQEIRDATTGERFFVAANPTQSSNPGGPAIALRLRRNLGTDLPT